MQKRKKLSTKKIEIQNEEEERRKKKEETQEKNIVPN